MKKTHLTRSELASNMTLVLKIGGVTVAHGDKSIRALHAFIKAYCETLLNDEDIVLTSSYQALNRALTDGGEHAEFLAYAKNLPSHKIKIEVSKVLGFK